MLIHEYLTLAACRQPANDALVCGTLRTSYGEIARLSEGCAAFLRGQGMQRGDRVIIFLDNGLDAVVAAFGVWMAGGCVVIVNPATQADRLAVILENSGATTAIASADRAVILADAEHRSGRPLSHVLAQDAGDFLERCNGHPAGDHLPMTDADLAAIIYTSGSTGKPKGVTMLHRNIHAAVESVADYLGHTGSDVVLNVLPLSSSYGLLQLLVTFCTGGTLVLEKGFGYPFEFMNKIRELRVTGFAGTPTIFALLLRLRDVKPSDVASVRYMTNAAAALPASFVPRLRSLFPETRIYLMHGLTECLRTTYLPPDEVEVIPTSVGSGMKNVELWVGAPDGSPLPRGETGELFVRGPSVMQGYWNDEQATHEALLPGRYPWERILRTRDLFTMDERGYLFFVARADELIKCKGEKVSPIEVEDVLYSLEGVAESRVIGIPDPVLGQAIKAEIVLREGASYTVQDVKNFCRTHLEDFKIPQVVAFVPELPKTVGGKIRRSAGS